MNETTKTAVYGGVALVAALLAALSIPTERTTDVNVDDTRFTDGFFAKLKSAEEVQGLRIIQPDDKGGEAHLFRVVQQNGRWVIASRNNYPADLKDQIKNAATAFVDLKPLPQVATEMESQHAQYGVVEPKEGKPATGEKDTGTLVELLNAKDDPIARLIIGRPVKGSPDQRFVRVPGEARVYTAIVSPDRFSTKFEDWIEKDLLKLKANDVSRVVVKDYVPEIVANEEGLASRAVMRRSEITLKFNEPEFKWDLDKLIVYRNDRPQAGKLLDNEEINGQRIDEMKNALADLKIVDVFPKPKALATSLRGQQVALDRESQLSLYKQGFPAFEENGEIKLLSVNGDVEVDTRDGVQYILRFGNIAGTQQGAATDKLNRYLMVSARLDPTAFPPPQLRPVPNMPAGPAADKAAPAKKKGDKQPAAGKDDAPKPPVDEKTAELEAERNRIIKENERLTNEWKERKRKAEQRVAELNDRFADWYFVVSEDGFKKVRFSLQDIVKEKEKEEGYLVDSFRKLEKEGLKKPKAPEGGPGGFPGGFPGGLNLQQ